MTHRDLATAVCTGLKRRDSGLKRKANPVVEAMKWPVSLHIEKHLSRISSSRANSDHNKVNIDGRALNVRRRVIMSFIMMRTKETIKIEGRLNKLRQSYVSEYYAHRPFVH